MFKNMEYVYMVYQEKSFSKAAEKLRISQPALSITIKNIENKLGTPIFNRNTTPISLTTFGIEYIQSIEKIYEIQSHIQNIALELDNLQRGCLTTGASSLGIPYMIPELICQFKEKYPHIKLQVLETSTLQSKQLLDSGKLDLIITNSQLNPHEYKKIMLYHEYLVVAVPKKFSINKILKDKQLTKQDLQSGIIATNKKTVSIAQFAHIPFIFLYKENYLRRCTDMLFEEGKILPNVILEVEQPGIAYNFAHYGLAATILSNTRVANLTNQNSLTFYKVRSDYTERDAFIYYRKSVLETTAMKKFIEEALQKIKEPT